MDIWVERMEENAKRADAALVEVGAPMADLTVHDLTNPTSSFSSAWLLPGSRRILGGLPISP